MWLTTNDDFLRIFWLKHVRVQHIPRDTFTYLQKQSTIVEALSIARGQIEQMSNMKQRLTSPPVPASLNMTKQQIESSIRVEPNLPLVHPSSSPLAPPAMSFAAQRTSEEENKKATAAAVAAKLTASTSSAQMLTSVLSSLVAEEAASVSGGLKSAGFISNLPMFSPEKRMKLDKPMSSADANNSEIGNTSYFTSLQQQPMGTMPLVPPTSIQPMNPMQSPFPPPPPPPVPPANSPANQFVQSAGMMMGIMPYGYGGNSLPPPPPLPSHIAMGLARPAPQPQQPQQMQSQQQQQQSPQPPTNGGYYRPPGIGFYGQSHQPTTQPVPWQ
ncbi:formin-like protein 7 [Camellia sinensis]|uniref:formin-like protein 7 n=1 Tax=Camellia sinensis TaxID=4442 RepID=UPI00103690BB|nr:formin-like protein 7 [Camellia sinensis]